MLRRVSNTPPLSGQGDPAEGQKARKNTNLARNSTRQREEADRSRDDRGCRCEECRSRAVEQWQDCRNLIVGFVLETLMLAVVAASLCFPEFLKQLLDPWLHGVGLAAFTMVEVMVAIAVVLSFYKFCLDNHVRTPLLTLHEMCRNYWRRRKR